MFMRQVFQRANYVWLRSIWLFWYDLPRQTSRYFESIRDLDAPTMDVEIARASGLLGDWKLGALNEKHIQHAINCIAAFGTMPEQEAAPIFSPYLQGLVFLSKSDIHLSCDHLARDAFLQALRNACRHFADWDGTDGTLIPSLHRVFESVIPDPDHRNLIFGVLTPPHQTTEGPFADAMSAKRLADLYLVLVADRLMAARMRREMPSSV
jgi:hypothetical protein